MIADRLRLLFVRLRVPSKLRNGRLRTIFDFCEAVANDYTAVAKDVIQGAKDRPLKSLLVTGLLTTAYAAYRTNPDEEMFRDQMIQYVHDMGMVDPVIRHPEAYEHVHQLYSVWNERRLRRLDLIFLSLLWQSDSSPESGHYSAHCQYLRPTVASFFKERLLDIGLFGRWRLLDHVLLDYDVNPVEWSVTSKPDV